MQLSYLSFYHLPWRKASIVLEIRPRMAASASDASSSSGAYSGSGVRSCGAGAVVVSAAGQAAGPPAGFSESLASWRKISRTMASMAVRSMGGAAAPYRLGIICKVSIVENDCIGDILCFPVVRLLFQQFDSCQMDRVTDIEPQGKPPSFFLNSHSRHLPTASRRYRYS